MRIFRDKIKVFDRTTDLEQKLMNGLRKGSLMVSYIFYVSICITIS